MSDNTNEIIGIFLLFMLIIMCAGKPDLLDAIICKVGYGEQSHICMENLNK